MIPVHSVCGRVLWWIGGVPGLNRLAGKTTQAPVLGRFFLFSKSDLHFRIIRRFAKILRYREKISTEINFTRQLASPTDRGAVAYCHRNNNTYFDCLCVRIYAKFYDNIAVRINRFSNIIIII